MRRVETTGAACVVGLFLLSHAVSWGPEPARLALGAVSLFLVPGYLIGRRIWHRSRWGLIHWVCISACLSLGVDVLTAGVFYLLRMNAGLLVYALCGLTLLLSVVLMSGAAGVPSRPLPTQVLSIKRDRQWMLATAVFAAALSLILLFSPLEIGYGEDMLGHIAVSREIVDTGQIVPLHEFYAGDEPMGEDPRVGLLHAVIASLGQGSGAEMLETWLWLRPLFSLLLVLSFGLFANVVFQDYRRSFFATVLFAFLYGGDARSANMVIYPSSIGMCVYWTGVFLAFEYGRRGGRDLFWGSALFVPLAAMIHVTPFINLWLSLAALCVLLALLAESKRPFALRTAKVLGTGTLLAAPYLLIRFLSSYGVVNPIHRMPQNVLHLGGGWLLPHPVWTIHWFMWVGLLAIPLGLSLVGRARKDEGLMLLFGNALVGTLLSAVPPLFTMGYRAFNFLALRFMMLVPHITILALFLSGSAVGAWRRRGRAARDLMFIGLVIVLILPDARDQSGIFLRHLTRFGKHPRSALDLRDAFRELDKTADGPGVVLADPLTGYAAAAMTRHAVIAMPPSHSSPRDSLSIARVHDVSLALNPNTPLDESIRIMRRYRVSHVMLNHTFEQSVLGYGFVLNPDRFEEQRAHFDSHAEYFEPVASLDDVHIYRLRPGGPAASPAPRDAQRSSDDPGRFHLPKPEAPAEFDGQFRLLGAEIREEQASRGETIHLVCCWTRMGESEFEKEYQVHVRFDRDYPKGRFWRPGWSKPYRRWLEWRRKQRYRFRVVRSPVENILPPARWGPGNAVIDSFHVNIPMNVAPGRYRVKVCLAARPVHPEMYLSDLLHDADRFDGIPIGWIDIR